MCDVEVPPIEDSVKSESEFLSVSERYFTRYLTDEPDHQCVLLHSNRICLITLNQDHQVIKDHKKAIKKIDFQVKITFCMSLC